MPKRAGRNPQDFIKRGEVFSVINNQNALMAQSFANLGNDTRLALYNLSALVGFLQSKGLFTIEEFKEFASRQDKPAVESKE